MPSFVLTQKAKDDLKEIARYTQTTWGRKQRNRYLAMLDGMFHDLAANPMKGRDCSNIRDGYWKLPVGKHIILSRLENGVIEIVDILQECMDIPSRLFDP
jgi:toxin ParE1/3/4